jgi:S-adenosylmethionine/arginine decarboxylase-like enzyme
LYTCGDTTNTHKAAEFLKHKLKAKISEERELTRSITPGEKGAVAALDKLYAENNTGMKALSDA